MSGNLRKNAAVAADGVTVAALAWRFRGVLQVTVVAKATFAFAADGPAVRVEPQPIFADEVHHGKRANQSIRFASDHAIYLTRAEVFLTGHAHAPQGASIDQMPVRLGIFDGARLLLDKTVLIRKKGGLQKIPLVYERAFGGMGFSDNPFGVGATDAADEPNILDLADTRRAAGFGPIAASWPARRGLLGEMPRKLLKAPVVELPDNFDWAYFQAAPADQRVDFFRGDEWIVIDGVSPTRPRVRTRLPGARGLARVHGLSSFGIAEGQSLTLHADTLRIDADEERCTLSFRGVFPVPRDEALDALYVAAGVELPGQPIAWPDMSDLVEGTTIDLDEKDILEDASGPAFAGTLMVGAEEIAPALPFQAGASPLSQPGRREARPLPDAVGTGTLVGEMDELPAFASAMTMMGAPDFSDGSALPFQPGFSAYAQPSPHAAPPPPDPLSGATLMELHEEEELERTLPFTADEAPPPLPAPLPPPLRPSPPPAPPPAAAEEPEEQVARWIPPPAAPEPPPPPPEAKKPAGSPWAPPPEAAPEPPPAPKPPPPQGPPSAGAALKKGVYGRFGKR